MRAYLVCLPVGVCLSLSEYTIVLYGPRDNALLAYLFP